MKYVRRWIRYVRLQFLTDAKGAQSWAQQDRVHAEDRLRLDRARSRILDHDLGRHMMNIGTPPQC
jgi:hypothetical protein